MDRPRSLQIQVPLTYKQEPREHPKLRRYLESGYRIANLQRLTDDEALVTLEPPAST